MITVSIRLSNFWAACKEKISRTEHWFSYFKKRMYSITAWEYYYAFTIMRAICIILNIKIYLKNEFGRVNKTYMYAKENTICTDILGVKFETADKYNSRNDLDSLFMKKLKLLVWRQIENMHVTLWFGVQNYSIGNLSFT